MKKILITGANSYVGTAFEKWLMKDSDEYRVDTLDMRNPEWQSKMFEDYDVIFHVAGIAHVSVKNNMEAMYYKVNRDLAVETAKKAKREGVKQFIFMSSIIVYGSQPQNSFITKDTVPQPDNFYGRSKLEAEGQINLLSSENFNVVILRPPMIYGRSSKGNYSKLAKLAQITPVFPEYNNKRSMLFIENLNELIKIIIDKEAKGMFFPQNAEYVKTSSLVKRIAEIKGKRIMFVKMFNPIIKSISKINVINKVFGDLVYDKELSEYPEMNYCIRSFEESIRITHNGEN